MAAPPRLEADAPRGPLAERTPRGTPFLVSVTESTPRGAPSVVETRMADGRYVLTKEPPDMEEPSFAEGTYESEATSAGEPPRAPPQARGSTSWGVSLDPMALALFEEARVDLPHSSARWADEQPTYAKLQMPAKLLLDSWVFKAVTMCAIATDILLVCYVAVADEDPDRLALTLISCVVLAVLLTDIFARVLAFRRDFFKSPFSYFEVALLVLFVVDEIVTTGVPFAVGRLVRALIMFRSTLDAVADLAMDKWLAKTLGDFLYISPENATAQVSEGILVIEKTHFLPRAFAGLHSPVTVKGGFIELVYIDLNLNKDLVIVLKNILVLLGPSLSSRESVDDLTKEDVALAKDKLVEMVALRVEQLLGGKKREQHAGAGKNRTFLWRLRHMMRDGALSYAELTSIKVDILNLEVRFEDFDLRGVPACLGLRARQTWCRITSGQDDTLGGDDCFRAVGAWCHEDGAAGDDWEEAGGDLASRRSSSSGSHRRVGSLEDELVMRLALRSTQVCAWCDHGDRVSRRPAGRRGAMRTYNSSMATSYAGRSTYAERGTSRTFEMLRETMTGTMLRATLNSMTVTRATLSRASYPFRTTQASEDDSASGRVTCSSSSGSCDRPAGESYVHETLSDVSGESMDPTWQLPWHTRGERRIGVSSQARVTSRDVIDSLTRPAHPPRATTSDFTSGTRQTGSASVFKWTRTLSSTPTRTSMMARMTNGVEHKLGIRRLASGGEMSSGHAMTYSQFFERDPPEVSRAARLFQRQGVLERFKLAARAAVERERQERRRLQAQGLGDVARAVVEKRLGSRVFRRFWDAVMPHSYILMPTAVSLHAMSRVQVSESARRLPGMHGVPPSEVLDLYIPRLAFQVSRTQVQLLGALQRNLLEWRAMDRRRSQMPVVRLRDAVAAYKHRVARSWWNYAVREIVVGINPGSKFAAIMQVQRLAGLSGWYTLLLFQRGLHDRMWDFARLRLDLRRSASAVSATWRRLKRKRDLARLVRDLQESSSNVGNFMRSGSADLREVALSHVGDKTLEDGPLNEIRMQYRMRRIRWHEQKERDLRNLQVALPLRDIIWARLEAKRLVLEEVTGQDVRDFINYKSPASEQTSAPVPAKTRPGKSTRSRAETARPKEKAPEDLRRGSGDEDPPRQARIHIPSINVVLVVERPRLACTRRNSGDAAAEPEEKALYAPVERQEPTDDVAALRELVRGELTCLNVVFSITAPMEEWDILTCAPTDVLDHSGDPAVISTNRHVTTRGAVKMDVDTAQRISEAVSGARTTRASNGGGCFATLPSPVPFDPVFGDMFPGWVGLEVSVASFSVVHCEAPAFAPSLHYVISRKVGSDVDFSRQASSGSKGGRISADEQTIPRRLMRGNKGSIMFLLRAAKWSQEDIPGSSRGIISVTACALQVLEYTPLAIELFDFFWPVVASRAVGKDPLRLAPRRARLRQEREIRHVVERQTRLFELASGAKNAGGSVDTTWKLLLGMADLLVTVVTPYTYRGGYLVSHVLVPGCVQRFERSPLSLYDPQGPSCRGAMALPGAAGVLSAAVSRALGVDLLTSDIPRGPPPKCASPRGPEALHGRGRLETASTVRADDPEDPEEDPEGQEAWGAIGSPWRPSAAAEEEHAQDWTASECLRVHVTTVPGSLLERELARVSDAEARCIERERILHI